MLNIKKNYFVREYALKKQKDMDRLSSLAAALESSSTMERYRSYEALNQTPLFRAVYKNDYEGCVELLRAKADTNHVDIFGNTPLSIACENNHCRIAKLLIGDCRLDFTTLDKKIPDGETLLTRAIKNGHYAVVRLLLECGADSNLVNNEEESPLKVACIAMADAIGDKWSYDNAFAISRLLVDFGAVMVGQNDYR